MSSYQIPPHVKLQSYANVIISISGRTAAAIIPVADKNQSLERKAGGCLALKIVLSTGAAPAAAYILYFSNRLTNCLDKRLLSTRRASQGMSPVVPSIEFIMQKGCKFCDMWSRRWGKLHQFHGGVTINKSRRITYAIMLAESVRLCFG